MINPFSNLPPGVRMSDIDPPMVTCDKCEGALVCQVCGGSGDAVDTGIILSAYVPCCPRCKGDGQCFKCSGTGLIRKD